MAETFVLNPVSQWVQAIDDNPSPDYGFTRTSPDVLVRAKAPGGQPETREVQNAGHTLKLSWLNRNYACVQRVVQAKEEYEDDYFTIIDHDTGRHYVGRFEGELDLVQNGNQMYDIRDAKFVCFPAAPMLVYPNNWDADGITIPVRRARGKLLAATSGAWTTGIWTDTSDPDNPRPATLVTLNNPGNPSEWIGYDYRGYGLKLQMITGRSYGWCVVYVDGNLMVLRNPDGTLGDSSIDLYRDAPDAPEYVAWWSDIPLDLHRVKIIANGGRNTASSSSAVSFVSLRVIR